MSIRQFALENAAGQRFGLNGERGVWFTAPEGLGYELAPPSGDLGRGFFVTLFHGRNMCFAHIDLHIL